MVAAGRDIAEAVVATQFVEKAAMIYIYAQSIGGPKPIPDEIWKQEREYYLYKYGKKEDLDGILTTEPDRP